MILSSLRSTKFPSVADLEWLTVVVRFYSGAWQWWLVMVAVTHLVAVILLAESQTRQHAHTSGWVVGCLNMLP